MLFVYIKMTFAVATWRNIHIAYPRLPIGAFGNQRNVLAGSIFCEQLDSAVVSPPGTAPTENTI